MGSTYAGSELTSLPDKPYKTPALVWPIFAIKLNLWPPYATHLFRSQRVQNLRAGGKGREVLFIGSSQNSNIYIENYVVIKKKKKRENHMYLLS